MSLAHRLVTNMRYDQPCDPALVIIENDCQQDKVNYAVSEREDRVTDVTTIKG